ncbi:MAG: hypothetical protein HZA90_08790 [Verrucomicrobia bacterium]|nr:hypothetical protein [Verrucomicrobiota bacterium]
MKSLRRSVPLVLLLLTFFADSLSAQLAARQSWVNRYNVDAAKINQTLGIVPAADGGVIVGGSSASTNGDLDYVLVKYTPSGTQAWLTRYDSPTHGHDQMRSLVLGSNGCLVVTGTSKTAKFDNGGNLLWAAPYEGRAVAVNASNVYVTGFSDVNFATAKLDGASGSNQWTRTHDLIGQPDLSQVMAVDEAGNVYVAGDEIWYYDPRWSIYHNLTTIKYDPNGTTLWTVRNDGSPYGGGNDNAEAKAILVDKLGGFCVMGNCLDRSIYLTRRFNAGLELVWDYHIAAAGGEGRCMLVDENGRTYLAGSRPTGAALYDYKCDTVKLNTNGAMLWLSTYHGPVNGSNQGTALALDAPGSVYVCGYSLGSGTGHDIFTLKYDKNGTQLWVQRYNGPANGDDIATGLVVDASGSVYVTGYSATTNGGTEFVTLKYTQPGLDIQRRSDGAMRLQTLTTPGTPYAFESSSNLQSWLPLATNTADTNGIVVFDDTNAPAVPRRFYRGSRP